MACTLETLGNRTLMQYQAARDTTSPIKAIRVTKIANLDVIFILTVVKDGKDALHEDLTDALVDKPDAITVGDTPYLLSSNVIVISVRVPINLSHDLFHAVVNVIQDNCEYFKEIEQNLTELIAKETLSPTPDYAVSNLEKLNLFLQNQILLILGAQTSVTSLAIATDYLNAWNKRKAKIAHRDYKNFAKEVKDSFPHMLRKFATNACGTETYLIPKMQNYLQKFINEAEAITGIEFIYTIMPTEAALQRLWHLQHPAAAEASPRMRLSII